MMPAPPLVSVIIPYFNHGECLRDAVISVEAQTYSNIEILVVDDGSLADSAADILGRRKARPFRILRHVMFAGLGAARNTGAAKAAGRFLAYVEAEDTIAETFVESAVAALESTPGAEILYSNVRTVGAFSEIREPEVSIPALLAGNDPPRGYVMARDLHESLSGYRSHMKAADNADFWLRLLRAHRHVLKLSEPLYFCRVGQGTRSSQVDYARRIVEELFQEHRDFYRENLEAILIEQKERHLKHRDLSRCLSAQANHLRLTLDKQHESLSEHYKSTLAASAGTGSEY